MKLLALMFALLVTVTSFDAEAAKRLGGGKSFGKQSSNVTQREAPPPSAAPQNATGAKAPAAAGAPAAAAPRPWGAMLGGLAAGLGLAWLANSLGFGEGLAQFLMFALLAVAAFVLFSWFMRRRNAAPAGSGNGAGGYAYQGAGRPGTVRRPYQPENVGNDSSARPWERNSAFFEAPAASSGSVIGADLAGRSTWSVPEGFDTAAFLDAARGNFIALQTAWDHSDTGMLRTMMTDEMFAEIRQQLAEREAHTGGQANHTDVVKLEAHMLGIEDLGTDYMASVEFFGMIREEPSSSPSPFREVWNMTKPKNGASGWLVAGVQALQ